MAGGAMAVKSFMPFIKCRKAPKIGDITIKILLLVDPKRQTDWSQPLANLC